MISRFSKYKGKKWLQGKFIPKHIEKYVGNVNDITYRSSWEKRLMLWLDNNENVLQWNSEETVLPYKSPIDGELHRYYLDFTAKIKTKHGIRKFLIEVKPYQQTIKPVKTPRKHLSTLLNEEKTYLVNQAKWKVAQQYAKKLGAEFIVLTEKELGLD